MAFDFECKNSKFFSWSDKYNDDIWNGDVCEAFISTDGGLDDYYEIEVAPNNTIFLKHIFNDGKSLKAEPVPYDDCFVHSEVNIYGNNYRVKFTVELDKMGYNKNIPVLYNAFRIETEGGISNKNLLSLNQTQCDTFHKPEFFVEYK